MLSVAVVMLTVRVSSLRVCPPRAAGDVPEGCVVVAGMMPCALNSDLNEPQPDWARTHAAAPLPTLSRLAAPGRPS